MPENKSIAVLVVDDDVLIAETINDLLKKLDFQNIKLAHSKEETFELLKFWKPDIAILDIRMTDLYDGLEIGEFFKSVHNIPFMYVTAHSDLEMTKRIMKTNPDGYITKPIRLNELMVNISMVTSRLSEIHDNKIIAFKNGYDVEQIPLKEFLFIKADGNYVEIIAEQRKYLIRNTLESFLREVDSEFLVRIHRSYAVNKLNIQKITSTDVEIGGNVLPISRSYAAELREKH